MTRRLEDLIERGGVGLFRADLDGHVLDCNQALAHMLGLESPAALLGRQTAEFYWSASERDALIERLMRDRRIDAAEVRLRHASGEAVWALASAQFVEGEPGGVEGAILNVSGRKRAEAHAARLGRVCRVLNQVARAVARSGDRGALLEEICRIAVEDGGLHAAWFAQPDELALVMRPVAIPVPQGTARFVSNDLPKDAGLGAWAEEAAGRGCRSCAVFPVGVDGGPAGVLGFYADEPGFFDEQTIEVLSAVAEHLSIALDAAGPNRAEARYRDLLEAAPDAILECDAEGRILVVNAAAEHLFGYSREELLERRIEELIPEPSSQPTEVPRKILARRKDGTEVPVEIGLSAVQTAQRGLVTCIVRDVAARMEAEEALRESDRRIASILESITDGFFAVDREWRFTYLNGRAEQIVGCKRAEVHGKRLWDEFPELADSVFRQELERAADTQRPIEFSAAYAPLHLWLDVHAYPSADGLSVYFQDVTMRKLAEEQSQQSQRLEALGRLAGEVAHDFNNLLTIIGGHSQIALESIDRSQTALHRDVEIVVEAAGRASALTRQLLTFSRRQALQPRVLDLNRVVTKMAKMLERVTREDIELRLLLRAGLWRVEADAGQVEQIIMNLAVNARDAMPRGGTLSIVTENREVTGESGTAPLAPGRYVLLAISDTGSGLDPETRDHVFEPFFTTKPRGKGTGLGLATVYGIVKQSGGEIRVDSEPGMGARFEVYFPRTDKTSQRQKDGPVRSKPRGGRETILLVEDEPGVRKLARDMLARLGYRVLEAASPAEALGIWESEQGSIDLLLTDVIMPQMSGRELADRLAESRPGLKILYVTGYSGDVILQRGVEAGKVELLQKPFSREALGRRVRKVLDSE
ncbi:MAG: PAS domain S-box protein [Bryobacteraceae bacterium]|jgi:PAS domain S-box-containing protein